MARLVRTLAVAAALAVAATSASDRAWAEDITVGGIALAEAYAGFGRGEIVDYEAQNPGYGTAIQYRGGDKGKATVYVYDLGLTDIVDGTTGPAVRDEFDAATDEVFAAAEHFPNLQVDLVDRYVTFSPEPDRQFLCAEFIMTESGTSRRSFLYLTGVGGKFLKIRVTVASNDPDDPSAHDFADALGATLWGQ